MPSEVVGQEQPHRNAHHLAGGEGTLHRAHHAPAHVQREEVGDDGKGDGTDHPSEEAGEDARRQQQVVVGSQAAQERAHQEARVKEHQEALAVEAVGKPRS